MSVVVIIGKLRCSVEGAVGCAEICQVTPEIWGALI